MQIQEENKPVDILIQDLSVLGENIRDTIWTGLEDWNEAEDHKQFTSAANGLNSHEVMRQTRESIREFQNFYINLHNDQIREAGNSRQIPISNWLLKNSSFLIEQVSYDLECLDDALLKHKDSMMRVAESIEDNAGLNGLWKGIKIGIADPTEAIDMMLGKGRLNKETDRLDNEFSITLNKLESTLEELIEKIGDIITRKWDDELLVHLEEMENFTPVHSIPTHGVPVDSRSNFSLILGFIIAGVIIGVVIVSGIGLLRHFGIF